MIFDQFSRPVASPEILRRLSQIDERLGLFFCGKPQDSNKGSTGSASWAFTLRWKENDPRRAMIARGEMPEAMAFDMIGQIPPDCTPDQAYGYFESFVTRWENADVERLRSRVANYNLAQSEINAAPARELGEELVHASHGAIGPSGEPTSPVFYQSQPPAPPKAPAAKGTSIDIAKLVSETTSAAVEKVTGKKKK